MLNIVKIRLYLNEEHKTILEKIFGSVRFVYNQNSRVSYQTTTAQIKEKELYLAKIGLIEINGFREFMEN